MALPALLALLGQGGAAGAAGAAGAKGAGDILADKLFSGGTPDVTSDIMKNYLRLIEKKIRTPGADSVQRGGEAPGLGGTQMPMLPPVQQGRQQFSPQQQSMFMQALLSGLR